ncbi:hypothetical protein Tco_1275289 [Tanacetum coccineum]
MSSSSSASHATVTYASVSSDSDGPSFGIPLVDVYGYESDASEATPQSLEHRPPSPDYAPEYTAPADDDLEPPIEDDPQEAEEDREDDPEEEPSEEEEELLAPVAFTLALAESVSPSEETDPFEEEEVAPTPSSPISPHHIILLPKTRLRGAQKSVRPQSPLPPSIKARIEAWHTAPASPSPPQSLLSRLSTPLPMIPSPPLPSSPIPRDPIPEADLPLRKRVRFAAPSYGFEIRESSAAATAR